MSSPAAQPTASSTPSDTRRTRFPHRTIATAAPMALACLALLSPTLVAPAAASGTATTSIPTAVTETEALDHVLEGRMGLVADPGSAFAARFGYVPVLADGALEAPDGGCSSPIPLPSDFEPACRAHDYGYDLVRWAGSTGPTGARASLDRQFDRRLHETCDVRTGVVSRTQCFVMANVASTAVRVNTVRQGGGAPVPEPLLPALVVIALTGLVGVAMAVFGRQRRVYAAVSA